MSDAADGEAPTPPASILALCNEVIGTSQCPVMALFNICGKLWEEEVSRDACVAHTCIDT